MQIYTVGGAVRDRLLGFAPQDVDYVVVGATPQQMLACGYRQVGADFPVFLHPDTGAQYALARTERQSSPGRRGLVHANPEVTLEEDLGRRDLTINAMALDAQHHLIDPYGGQADLEAGLLRHGCPTSFGEDPIRVLRIARFLARHPHFQVAPKTLELCRDLARSGALNGLVAERVWQELSKGLLERSPSRMVDFLVACGALPCVLPELSAWVEMVQASDTPVGKSEALRRLDVAAKRAELLEVCFAVLCQATGLFADQVQTLAFRLKLPQECRYLSVTVCRELAAVGNATELDALELVQLLHRVDAFSRPARLRMLLQARECCAHPAGKPAWASDPEAQWLRDVYSVAAQVSPGAVAQQCTVPAEIAPRVQSARVQAVQAWLQAQR